MTALDPSPTSLPSRLSRPIAICGAAFMAITIAFIPAPAHAIDCAKSSTTLDRMICGNPGLLRADTAMGRAYAGIVRAAPDPEIRAMLVRSQQRWIAARNDSFGKLDGAVDGTTGEGYSKQTQQRLVLTATVERTGLLGTMDKKVPTRPALIQWALEQRQFVAKYTGGEFAGFSTECTFLPDRSEEPSYSYGCFGAQQYQNGKRLCAEFQDWASWRVYTGRTFAEIVASQPKVIATCKEDSCFDTKADPARWSTGADAKSERTLQRSLPKLDAEIDLTDPVWLNACLTHKAFPSAS